MLAPHYGKIGPESDAELRVLFQHYLRDMAEWFEFDAAAAYDAVGVWASGNSTYLATVDDAPVGFALIGSGSASDSGYDVHEFFVLPEMRRLGVGQGLAAYVWDQHPGAWLVRVLDANAAAVLFWRKAVSHYSSGDYAEESRTVNGRAWTWFRFRSKSDTSLADARD